MISKNVFLYDSSAQMIPKNVEVPHLKPKKEKKKTAASHMLHN
jgi:hypothetical protein